MDAPIPDIQQLGRAIWEMREEKGIAFGELAKAAEIDPANLNRAENHGKNLTFLTLSAIARVLGVPVSALIVRAESIAKSSQSPKA
jgi:transcriptional regulator with XRE-family HTH domain